MTRPPFPENPMEACPRFMETIDELHGMLIKLLEDPSLKDPSGDEKAVLPQEEGAAAAAAASEATAGISSSSGHQHQHHSWEEEQLRTEQSRNNASNSYESVRESAERAFSSERADSRSPMDGRVPDGRAADGRSRSPMDGRPMDGRPMDRSRSPMDGRPMDRSRSPMDRSRSPMDHDAHHGNSRHQSWEQRSSEEGGPEDDEVGGSRSGPEDKEVHLSPNSEHDEENKN